MLEPLNSTSAVAAQLPDGHYLSETLIEKIWFQLDEQTSREQIRRAAAEVAHQFQNATVTTFIPIFVYRQTYEKLKRELGGR